MKGRINMKIDFHTHVKLSKKVDFELDFFHEVIENARASGLTAIAMTEHFNTKNYDAILDLLDEYYVYKGDYYDVDGIKVFTGMEIDVKEVGHILFIGHKAKLLRMNQYLEFNKNKDNFISLADLLDLGEMHDMLMIGAHPLRESTPLHHQDHSLLKRLHAFDLNGKDMHIHGIDKMRDAVDTFSNEIGIPVVCGSDSHHPIHIGVVHNIIEKECMTAKELKQEVLKGNYRCDISPILHTKVHAAQIVKKKMKETLLV